LAIIFRVSQVLYDVDVPILLIAFFDRSVAMRLINGLFFLEIFIQVERSAWRRTIYREFPGRGFAFISS
jgi:hypothetical protein